MRLELLDLGDLIVFGTGNDHPVQNALTRVPGQNTPGPIFNTPEDLFLPGTHFFVRPGTFFPLAGGLLLGPGGCFLYCGRPFDLPGIRRQVARR